jgi:putative aldouronate transport system permease protein
MKRQSSEFLFNCINIFLCAFIVIAVVYPVYFVVIASISNPSSVANGNVWLYPKGFTMMGYQEIMKDARIWVGYKNTLIYAIGGMLVSMFFTMPAAYALSRKDFKARGFLMLFFTFTMFFNGGLIPTYLTIKKFHLDNTIWVMLIPFSVNVYNIIISRTFYQNNIPGELLEAAILDGCTNIKFFIKVVLPLSKAILAVISLYYIVGYWNEYFKALIYLREDKLYPLQMVLRDILIRNQAYASGQLGAGASAEGSVQQKADLVKYGVIVVSSLPIIIIYPLIQKYFEKGVMIGSLKG